MRVRVLPERQGSERRLVTPPVQYLSAGIACFVSVVKTSTPSSPSGTGWPLAGSTISGRKWSSFTWEPSRASTHSFETPGPMISDRP